MTTIVTAANVKPLAWCQGCGFIGFQEEMTAKSKPWHPAEVLYTCSACQPVEALFAQRVLDNMTALQEASDIRTEHERECPWCESMVGQPPPLGGWANACRERRRYFRSF